MSDVLAASGVVGESPAPAGAPPGAVPAHVKVAVRIRPLLPTEVVDGSRSCVTHPGRGERYLAVGTGRSQRLFGFDHVFGGDASQAEVYSEIIAPLLDQVVAGCNVGVLAYGQTGSGKTHSLLGARVRARPAGWLGYPLRFSLCVPPLPPPPPCADRRGQAQSAAAPGVVHVWHRVRRGHKPARAHFDFQRRPLSEPRRRPEAHAERVLPEVSHSGFKVQDKERAV